MKRKIGKRFVALALSAAMMLDIGVTSLAVDRMRTAGITAETLKESGDQKETVQTATSSQVERTKKKSSTRTGIRLRRSIGEGLEASPSAASPSTPKPGGETLPGTEPGTEPTASPSVATSSVASPSVPETRDPFEDTTNYSSAIVLAEGKDRFYGGEPIYLYNELSVSGNEAEVPEGSYTLIYLDKESFTKPKSADISTNYEKIARMEILEDSSDYIIKTVYKKLYGGYTGATPLKVSLRERLTENGSESLIRQAYFSPEDEEICSSELTVQGLAAIESVSGTSYSPIDMKEYVDENFVLKEGTTLNFPPNYISYPNSNRNDPRDRRIYVTVPKGTKLKENSGWTYESAKDRYYKDIPRDQVNVPSLSAQLDISGTDLNAYDTKEHIKVFTLYFSIQPLKDGEPQTDLGPNTWSVTRRIYAEKVAPPSPDAYVNASSYRTFLFIGPDHRALKGRTWRDSNYVNVPYDDSLLGEIRIALDHMVVYSFYINNPKGDEEARSLLIKSSRTDVPGYSYPSEIRLVVRGLGADGDAFAERLRGTKAYGIRYDGSRELITDDVPIVTESRLTTDLGSEDWYQFDGSAYRSVVFEYPDGGLLLEGKDEINKYYSALNTMVVADLREALVDDLKQLLKENKVPSISAISRNAPGYSRYDDYSWTEIVAEYRKKEGDETLTRKEMGLSADSDNVYRLQYEQISANTNLGITNGNAFYVDDTVTTRLSYVHNRYGNFADATAPENLYLYYLVPDGLEPIEDPSMFESLEVIRNYQPGKNLIMARPKEVNIPSIGENDSQISRGVTNYYDLSFRVTERMDIGAYRISAAAAIDNNKIAVQNGRQYGILMSHTPQEEWNTITQDAGNRPEDPNSYTNLGRSNFSIYPPRVLVSTKAVKLASEADTAYASSTGQKASIGTTIDYRLRIQNNSPQNVTELTLLDILPYKGDRAIVENEAGNYPSRGSAFRTPLLGVEDQEKFDIYYSTDPVGEDLEANKNASWQSEVQDPTQVTMIKAVLKPGQTIKVGEKYDLILHNMIENNSAIEDGEKAYNSFAISLNRGVTFVEALKTEVQVVYPKRDVTVEKTGEDDPKLGLEGVSFDLYMEGREEPVKTGLVTDRNGHLTLPSLLIGKTYRLRELTAPEGYALPKEDVIFTVEESSEAQELHIVNYRPRREISVAKAWEGNTGDSAEILLLADGTEIDRAVLTKENNWSHTFTGLREKAPETGAEISYTIKEAGTDETGRLRIGGSLYQSSVEGDMEQGFTVRNKWIPDQTVLTPAKRNFPVHKEWQGIDPKDAPEVTVYLLKNGSRTGKSLKLNQANHWSGEFRDLPVVDSISQEKANSYTVLEAGEQDGKVQLQEKTYQVSYEGGNILNTLETPTDPNSGKGHGGGSGGGGGHSGGHGGGSGGGGTPVTTPNETQEAAPPETPGDVPPAPWYKLPVMGDTQFGPGFVHERVDEVSLPEASEEPQVIDQLKELYEQNRDLSGWLTVPGTGFGYPVMNTPDTPYYYQHHTFAKRADEVGIPFTGPYCTAESMNVLIHGHNMKDVSQFGYIWNYQYPEFREKNPTIDFKTLHDASGTYEVMVVFFAPEYPEDAENVFWWYRYIGDMNKAQFDYYVQHVKAASLYDTGLTAEYGDKLITLETCASSTDSTRLVVVARKKAS